MIYGKTQFVKITWGLYAQGKSAFPAWLVAPLQKGRPMLRLSRADLLTLRVSKRLSQGQKVLDKQYPSIQVDDLCVCVGGRELKQTFEHLFLLLFKQNYVWKLLRVRD